MAKTVNLAAFIDGTWNAYADASNVRRLCESVVTRRNYRLDGKEPTYLTYANYEAGPGTDPDTQLTGGAFAADIARPIGATYAWLATRVVNALSYGEKSLAIELFGFSRGAYCAHVLSWLLSEVGLPRRTECAREIAAAYVNKDASRLASVVRGGDCRPSPEIRLLGLYDVVSAPLDVKSDYHDGEVAPRVTHVRHAMAIDERRLNFNVLHYQATAGKDVEQVWFAGVHGDVGGIYADDRRLGDITLNWMGSHARELGLGLSPKPDDPLVCSLENLTKHDEAVLPEPNRAYRPGDVFHPTVAWLKAADPGYQVALLDLPETLTNVV